MSEPENNPLQPDPRQDSYEGEAAVLASMILKPDIIGALAGSLPVDTFHRPENKILYETLAEIFLNHSTVDIILLRDELKKRGLLEQVGGVDYIIEIMQSVPTAANAQYYSNIVKDAYRERQLEKTVADIQSVARDIKPLPERVAAIQEKIMSLDIADNGPTDLVDFSKNIGSIIDSIRSEDDFIKTGLAPIDGRILGFLPGELVVIAARPRHGKSALALQIAVSVARAGRGVLFVSLEMSVQSLRERILSSEASVDLHEFARWGSAHDAAALRLAESELKNANLNLTFSTTTTTPTALAVMVKRLKKTKNLKLVFIDFLQLMGSGTKTSSLREKITEISRQLKLLALAENITIVALSQLNREVEARNDHTPRLSDLRESGSIEQDADVVMLLNRRELYAGQVQDGKAELTVAKSRRGPAGLVELSFAARYTRFGEVVGGVL